MPLLSAPPPASIGATRQLDIYSRQDMLPPLFSRIMPVMSTRHAYAAPRSSVASLRAMLMLPS